MSIIILERDTIMYYEADGHTCAPEAWHPIPGSLKAIARLSQNAYRVIVTSTPPHLDDKPVDIDILNAIHKKILTQLVQYGSTIDVFFLCAYSLKAKHDHKLRSDLYKSIQERLRISMAAIPCVIDTCADIEAVNDIGAQPIFVKTDHGQRQIDAGLIGKDIPIFNDLTAMVENLLT